jgi:hypothetical protein
MTVNVRWELTGIMPDPRPMAVVYAEVLGTETEVEAQADAMLDAHPAVDRVFVSGPSRYDNFSWERALDDD